MGPWHPETELIAYLDGTLASGERARVATHLDGCAGCRATLDEYRGLLARLPGAVPEPPPVHWGRYRADLRARLEARSGVRAWTLRPLQAVLSAGLVAVMVVLAMQSTGPRPAVNGGVAALEAVTSGVRLDLIQKYPLLERLDLLEDLDLIVQLDRLARGGEG